jgi:hypothetical protein
MIITIHQKILLRKTLSKHGVNVNKLCTQVNDSCDVVRKAARKQLAFLVHYCTGKNVMFTLQNPYTKYYKGFRSMLNDGQARHIF